MQKNNYEYDNFINGDRPLVSNGKEDFVIFFQSIEKEVVYSEQEFVRIKQELADIQAKVNQLVAKEEKFNPRLLELEANIDSFSPQEIKETYETIFGVQVLLAAAQEQKLFWQKHYGEWETRLADLYKRKENAEKLSAQIDTLIKSAGGGHKAAATLPVLVESSNFGLKIIKVQEEERRRVAREIHDGPAQAMANVIFLAEVCEKLIAIDTARAKRELQELRNQVRGCLEETRKIIFDLRPMALDDLGLIPTVKRIVDILKERMGLKINVKVSGVPAPKLDSHIEVSLFRIIQESLNNIEKHSNASEAQVLIEFQGDYVTVIVKDNGSGFDVEANHKNSKSFGLLGMKERVNLLNGELKIHSQRGSGTEITVKTPLFPASKRKGWLDNS